MAVTQQPAGTDDRRPSRTSRFRALLGSVAVSSLGDGALMGALPLAAAAVTRDPAAVAFVTVAMYLPWLVVSPAAGALIDRWPYRPVMVAADLARGLCLMVLTALVVADAATIAALSIVAFAVVTGQIFHDTAVQSTVAVLAERDPKRLDHINGRIYGVENAGKSLIGPPAGSAAWAAVPWLPFAFDAASFIGSAVLLRQLPAGLRASAPEKRAPLLRAMREGASWLARHHQLRTVLLLSSTANFSYGMAWSVFVLLVTDGLNATPSVYGLLVAAYALGGVIIGPLTSWITGRVGATRTILAVSLAHAAAWPLIAAAHSPWTVAPLLAAVGAAQTLVTVCVVGLRQALVPAELLGRVTSAFRTVGGSATPLGALGGGLLAAQVGLRLPLVVGGVALAAAVLIASVVLFRSRNITSG